MTPDENTIKNFLHGQVACWNACDKEGFFAHYRAMAPNGLRIDYAGQPPREAWQILEGMWTQQNTKIRIEVKASIVNGSEAACHHRNAFRDAEGGVDTIEVYRFLEGRMEVRYFIAR